MMKHIILFEIKRSWLSLFWWSLAIVIFGVFMFAFFPLMADQQQAMDLILEHYPVEMLKAFGLSNVESLSTLKGYVPFVFIFTLLINGVFASLVGFKVLSEEESDKTADFLFSKPISRNRVFIIKNAIALYQLFVVFVVSSLSTTVVVAYFITDQASSLETLIVLYEGLFYFQLLFYTLAMVISMMFNYVRSSVSLAIALSFLMYALYSIGQIIDTSWLLYSTPFYYFEAAQLLMDQSIPQNYIYLTVLVSSVALVISYLRFVKKDFFVR